MFDLGKYLRASGAALEAQLVKKDGCEVFCLQREGGGRFILRVYSAAVPAYEALTGAKCPAMPEVYACRREDSAFLVEEEFIDGVSLQETLKYFHPDEAQTAAIAAEICRALEFLHAQGIVHRDVKPKNVILTAAGRVTLIDLDASAAIDPERGEDTRLLGTPGYAAPEQFGFSRSDMRTDIFALGVMMNVMLTGEHPSKKLAEGVLRRNIEKCINVNADMRYSSAGELLHSLPEYSGKAVKCTECGFFTPGGGCLYCGRPSGARTRKKRLPVIIAAIALMFALAAAFALPALTAEDGEAILADGETLSETAFIISEAPPLQTPAPSPAPTPDPLQLYHSYNGDEYETYMGNPAGGSCWMNLYVAEGGGYINVDDTWRVWCDEGFGTMVWDARQARFVWEAFNQIPGTAGKLYAEKDGVTYSMDAWIKMASVGIYSVKPDAVDISTGYLGKASGDRYAEYSPGEDAELWLVIGNSFDWTFDEASATGGIVSAEISQDRRQVKLKLPADAKGSVSSDISVTAGENIFEFYLTFTPQN